MKSTLEFLQHFGDDFFIQTFDDKKRSNRVALTERRWTLAEAEKKLPALSNLNLKHDAGIYFCVNLLKPKARRNSDNIESVRGFFVDLDGSPIAPVLDWTLQPNIVVQTSADRYHAYWLLDDHYDDALRAFRDIQRWLANKFNGDKSIVDLCRVMRLPGFFNMKHEPFNVTWQAQKLQPYKLKEIKDAMDADKACNTNAAGNLRNARGIAGVGVPEYLSLQELKEDAGRGGNQNAADEFEFDARRLKMALSFIPSDDYADWMRVGMALQGSTVREDAELSAEEAFEYWLTWSEGSAKFADGACEEKWEGMNARGELGLGTIFEMARQNGWQGNTLKLSATYGEWLDKERRRLGITK